MASKMRVAELKTYVLEPLEEVMREALELKQRRLFVFAGKNNAELAGLAVNAYVEKFNSKATVLYVADSYEEGTSDSSRFIEFRKAIDVKVKLENITYDESENVLGTTWDVVILDLHSQVKPNDLGRLVELARGGGFVVLLTPRLSEWCNLITRFHRRLLIPPYTEEDIRRRFLRRAVSKLLSSPGVWVVEDGTIIKGEPYKPKVEEEAKIVRPSESIFPRSIYELAKTQDQVDVLTLFEKLTERPGKKSVLLITANRGRGKTAVLGLGAAAFYNFLSKKIRRTTIIMSSPSIEGAQTFFEFACKALDVLGLRYEKVFSKGKVVALKLKRGVIEFRSPYSLTKRKAELVIVDEAAATPVPLLFKIFHLFDRIVYSSTIHGYEGAGRGFGVRFLRALKAEKDLKLYEREMTEPIRYAKGDPIEQWLYETLLLDAEPCQLTREEVAKIKAENCVYVKPNLDYWFNVDDRELRDFIGIYVLAHYRNRPDDLAILGDAPHHSARALKADDKIVVALHIAEEGRMPREVVNEVLEGRAPPGNVIPAMVAKYYSVYRRFCAFKGLRIIRIATHPELWDKGLGSKAIEELTKEAEAAGYDWIGAGFGVNEPLLKFWIKNGFLPIHMSPARNMVSGEYTVIVVKPLSKRAKKLVYSINRDFKLKLIETLPDTYFTLEPRIAVLLLSSGPEDRREPPVVTKAQLSRLESYVKGVITYEGASDAVKALLRSHFLSSGNARMVMPMELEAALVAKNLQGKSWRAASNLSGVSSDSIKREIREAVKRLISHYIGGEGKVHGEEKAA